MDARDASNASGVSDARDASGVSDARDASGVSGGMNATSTIKMGFCGRAGSSQNK